MPTLSAPPKNHHDSRSCPQCGFHSSRTDQLPRLRQRSMRETTLWDSHPPNGRRARLIEAWPVAEPKVTVGVEEWAALHAELAGWYEMAHRLALGTRKFRAVPVPRQS